MVDSTARDGLQVVSEILLDEFLESQPNYIIRAERMTADRWRVENYEKQYTPSRQTKIKQYVPFDELPPDVKKQLSLLMMVEPNGVLEGVGHRVGSNVFWFTGGLYGSNAGSTQEGTDNRSADT